MDLELFSTKELLAEIQKRATFAGIIISSTESPRNYDIGHVSYDLYSAFDGKSTTNILKSALKKVSECR